MKSMSRVALAVALVSSVAMSGCAYNSSSPDVYTASQAQREETVRMATVESVRGVKISSNNGQPSGLGAIGGGALGAVAGSTIGGGTGSILTGIIGGLAGAVAGNAVENNVAVKNGLEITVRLDNGDMRAITQTSSGEVFQAGERVRLLSSGGVTRVTH
ncbi:MULTISPECIES: glycine zipper 2TM domain-containing protein [Caballeronia]|jgi:outer membrane lipoprotein SlyB|uniref:17 kDa surface antigen n=1 Tax=Caballeronia telluris TaxID=326475 RepID=A0A158JMH5_9BURK|nr:MULTISPECIES: glycine zipper 2TM domain-containing protein [Caballeronia]MDR5751678.1 glycine zipper 2TM domain-containing protein [Caballeronia sp. LZ024]MDR5844182.1 glycine zipper 2TM domain-containing protein [Caballeronia sp. LZ031]SAL70086.1 17 kDa surface antigen [Caballeronia telluris]